jgi:hypothetical protein
VGERPPEIEETGEKEIGWGSSWEREGGFAWERKP